MAISHHSDLEEPPCAPGCYGSHRMLRSIEYQLKGKSREGKGLKKQTSNELHNLHSPSSLSRLHPPLMCLVHDFFRDLGVSCAKFVLLCTWNSSKSSLVVLRKQFVLGHKQRCSDMVCFWTVAMNKGLFKNVFFCLIHSVKTKFKTPASPFLLLAPRM